MKSDNFYISYSGYKKYETCNFAYWNSYIAKTPLAGPDDRLGSIYGSVVGQLFEQFYMEQLWRKDNAQAILISRIEGQVDAAIKKETSPSKFGGGGVLMWKGDGEGQNPFGMYETKEELVADIRDTIPRGFRIIRHHRLLGPRAEAETKLDFKAPNGDIWGGRSDFIIQRAKPHEDLIIVDGKGSKHRDKYVDPTQLQWYSMLYKLNFGSMPDRLAFLFWRYEPTESIDWVSTSEGEVQSLFVQVRDTIEEIKDRQVRALPMAPFAKARDVFTTKANKDNCRFCPYATEEICPKGAKVQQEIKAQQASRAKGKRA